MKYIYAAIMACFATSSYSYDVTIPQNDIKIILSNPVPIYTQVMVYTTPYFTVTVPVTVTTPVAVAQPVQQTFYWGYPYQPGKIYYWNNNYRLLNFNY